jgi:WD40 repeat protein
VAQALNVLRWLSGTAGWDRSHALLLTDLGGNEDPGSPRSPAPNIAANKKNLDWAFQRWLPARARPGDLIVFYFAGQARAAIPADPSLSPEYYLLPSDATVDNLPARGWSLDQALDRLARSSSFRMVCWLGTTMQAEPAAGGQEPRRTDAARLNRDWLRRVARWPGVTAWLASDRPPVAPTSDPLVPFTRTLLAGLGDREQKRNLAACLRALELDSKLKAGGFQAIGGVPPELSLWADQLGVPAAQPKPEMVLQVGHADRILEILSTPDSRTLITASQDSTIRVWSPGSKSLLRTLTGHAVGVTAMTLSGDGRWLVSGGGRGEILIHDLSRDFARQSVARQPHDEGSRIVQVAMLPDGARCVTIDSKGQAVLWDLSGPTPVPGPWIEGVVCRQVATGGSGKEGIVAALCGDGTVRLFGASGAGGTLIPLPTGRAEVVAISPDGRFLGVGFEDGRVMLRDLNAAKQVERRLAEDAIQHLTFSAEGSLAIGHAKGVRMIEVRPGPALGADAILSAGNGAGRLVVSPDGRLLAACAQNTGALRVWKLDGDPPRTAIVDEPNANVLTLAFTTDGRTLVTGSKLGTIHVRPVDDRGEGRAWTVPANRGKVQQVSPSPGRRYILVINELRQAHLWDLAQRSCRRLAGVWAAGAFLDDDRLVLAGASGGEYAGRLVRVDRRTLAMDGASFARSEGAFRLPDEVRFEVLAVSADGGRIAAAAEGSPDPLVCVWETAGGRLSHWIKDPALDHPAFSLSFSGDGRQLATAGDSKQAELWDLGGRPGAIPAPAVTFRDATSTDITSVRIRPGANRQIVTGHSDGRILLWSWADDQDRQQAPSQVLAERYFYGAVHALTFTADGRYLAAAGVGSMIWLAEMEPRVRQIRDLGTPPHHFEQINCLASWPERPGPPANGAPLGPPTLISGSDDTTIRFWDLGKRTLLGTFAAASTEAEPAGPDKAGASRELDWVLYTPDGHFDASPAGRDLVRFRMGDRGHALEQFDGTALYSFDLTDHLREGRPLVPARLDPPPPLAIDPPAQDDPTVPQTRLRISLGAADFRDVRLYHNGVPIPSGLEETAPPLPEQFDVRVRLLPGINRFYVMASRDGAFDSRSAEVEIPYEGAMEPGRLHVIALGVGNYDREKLNFAKRDAERLSEVLHLRGLARGQERGKSILLTDERVNAREVTRAFNDIGREVKGHPQDTVVLFLAGHTGVFENERFCLLLHKYPFPPGAPLMVAARDANPPIAPGAKVSPDDLLPYSTLAVNLMRLDALNRLVIVDACQAESILADPQVDAIRKWMEIGSRKARTSYLMAARRGEPALEVEPLGHGLFTYTLLRGMREIPTRDEPPEIARLDLRPDADYNGDGVITTAELDRYVKDALPPIAGLFPDLVVKRAAVAQRAGNPPAGAVDRLDQALRFQAAPTSIPLIRLGPAPSASR